MTATPTAHPATANTTASAAVIIKCMQLTKVFRDFWMRNRVRAVDEINLEVYRGEVFGLLGPNGSGKSTTIKMILGLLKPTAGRVAVFGKTPDDVATKKRIGFLPEESYLYPFLNARETLDYYGRLFHQNRPQRNKRIDMLLEMVGLEAVQRRPIREYSKGMQRRIGLAQALINDPELLILDEPTTGMDPLGTRQIKNLIMELARHGKTILLSSHLLADVEDVCHRVAILYGGRIIEHGSLDQLLTQQNATTIQAEALDEATLRKIEQILLSQGKHIEKVTHPRQTLEHKFLDLVKRAQATGSATSGATAGNRIAGFLTERGDGDQIRSAHLPQTTDAAKVIDQLIEAPATEPVASHKDEPTPPPEEPAATELIDNLLHIPEASASPATEKQATPPPSTSVQQPDQDLIDSLIDQPSDPQQQHGSA